MEKIYKEYTSFELTLDEPCEFNDFKIYPVKVKDSKLLDKYTHLLVNSKKHLGIEKENIGLLTALIGFEAQLTLDRLKLHIQDYNLGLESAIDTFKKLIKITTKTDVEFTDVNGNVEFVNCDRSVIINDKNYNDFRRIVMKMNLLKQDKVFEDEEMREWYYRWKKSQSKGNNLGIEEMIFSVSEATGFDISKVKEMNIFQLNGYYLRIMHKYNAETTRSFALVNSKQKIENYISPIVKPLYKEDSDKDMFTNMSELEKLTK